MKKKSISDQCLVKNDLKMLAKSRLQMRRLSKSKSEEKFLRAKSSRLKAFIDPRRKLDVFKTFKFRSNAQTSQQPTCTNENINKNIQMSCVQLGGDQRKTSLLFQATACVEYESYQDLNEKLDIIKQSMMNNLNRLIERDVSIQNLEAKADILSKDAFNLQLISNNVKKAEYKNRLKSKFVLSCVFSTFLLLFLIVCFKNFIF